MVEKICLDSDIIIEILKDNQELKEKLEFMVRTEDELCTTSINIFETWSGRENNEAFRLFLEELYRFPFEEESAKKAAVMFNEMKKKGLMIEPRDIFIAAICITHQLSLLTNNKK